MALSGSLRIGTVEKSGECEKCKAELPKGAECFQFCWGDYPEEVDIICTKCAKKQRIINSRYD